MARSSVVLVLLSCVLVLARRPSSRDRQSGSTADTFSDPELDTNSRGRGTGDDSIPDFVRVEITVDRLEDDSGVIMNGKKCDFFKSCDPRVYVYLDSDQPSAPYPGPVPAKTWKSIFEASNTNSPTIGKTVTKDICGGSVNQVNLRVHVVDVDTFSANDDLMNFDCIFNIDPRDIADSADAAQSGPSTQCTAAAPGPAANKIKLFTRLKAFQIPSSDCQATGQEGSTQPVMRRNSNNNNGRQRTSMSDSGSRHVPGQHDFLRIDVELVQLLNPQGVLDTGKSCDVSGACDPLITGYLDTGKPMAQWPGSKTVPEFQTIFKASNTNSPIISKNISTNICGGSVRKVNLRVHVVDQDTFSRNDFIANFQCLFTADYRRVASDISDSDWASTQDCQNLNPKNDIRLQYRYRLYDIPQSQCGIRSTRH